MTCTHATCTTAFCPHCGEGVGSPIPGHLLSHIRVQVGKWEREVRERQFVNERIREERVASAQRTLDKWTAWESWVAAHIAKDAEGEA